MNQQPIKEQELPYIALAPLFEWMREWCWRNGLQIRNVRYIFDLEDAYALFEYDVILFDQYLAKYDSEAFKRIMSRARNVYQADIDFPIVKDGKIIGWKK
jgi:hypothetical protein